MLILAFDGADFHGWQNQPNLRTAQGTLEQALRRCLRHQVALIGCSRTDSGVHAAGYVANCFTTSPTNADSIARSLGSRLPKDMTLLHLAEVPLTFHATRSAITKLYRYRIHNVAARPCEHLSQRFVYHFWQPLDMQRMQEAASNWVGRHDFTSFASAGNPRQSNVRTIRRIELYRVDQEIRMDIEGEGFLYKQVRNMMGTLVEIGRGRWPVQSAKEILEAKDRSRAGPTAAPRGLCLQWVKYDLPNLPAPSAEMIQRAEAAEPPKGGPRERVDHHPRSTAPMPQGVDQMEEPSA
jgi:tRNA pseudouridine38-40 synthase